ncbi:catalase, partial [Nostoc sp. HG1]|nr:catalase [Nostoc sp. HG1]
QARLFSYPDAQRYRLGGNYQQLPVNQPKCPVMHNQRDGLMALGNNGGSVPNYELNSAEGTPKENPAYAEPPSHLGDVTVDRYSHREGNDDYTQAGNLYRLLTPEQQERLAHNIVGSLSQARQDIQMRQLCHFFRADISYGRRVAEGLGISIDPSLLPVIAQAVSI